MVTVVPLALTRRRPAGTRLLLTVTRVLLTVTRVLLTVTPVLLTVTRVLLAMPRRHFDVYVVPRTSRSVCRHTRAVG